jgi:hypothetical protein
VALTGKQRSITAKWRPCATAQMLLLIALPTMAQEQSPPSEYGWIGMAQTLEIDRTPEHKLTIPSSKSALGSGLITQAEHAIDINAPQLRPVLRNRAAQMFSQQF